MRELGTYGAHLSKVVVSTSGSPGCDVVHLSGHLDLNTAAYVAERVASGPEFEAPRLVLELGGLELLDSSGIGALVRLHHAAADRDARLVVVTDSAHLRKLLKISGLDQVIAIHDDVEGACSDDAGDPGGFETAG